MDRGGLERVVCDLAQEQLLTGHRVSIVCLFRDGLLAEEARQSGAPVEVVGKKSGFDIGSMVRLRRALNATHADVIHTHNATAHYHVALLRRAARSYWSIPAMEWAACGWRIGAKDCFPCALGRTAAVAAVCQAAATRFVADRIVPADVVRVVPNGIRLREFGNRDRNDARRQLGLPEDAMVIGTVGRLNWAKDHGFLLRAFHELGSRGKNAVLVIIGEGDEREAIGNLARELGLAGRVRLLGDRSDVPALLPAIDIFALSSRTEGYSIALLEACAAGIAIVATDVGGNGEIVRDRRHRTPCGARERDSLFSRAGAARRVRNTSRAVWQQRPRVGGSKRVP